MYGNPSFARRYAWQFRRTLRLSPTQKLFREFARRGVPLSQMNALEMFGADGLLHTVDYYPLVKSLEIWELKDQYLNGLHQNFPQARIKITDSFREIQTTPNRFDLIVADGPCNVVGPNREYCEHFELMTNFLFRVANPSSLIVLTVVPDPVRHIPTIGETATYGEYLERRSKFYGTDHPELIPVEEMVPAYQRAVEANGFRLEWHVSVRRTIRTGVYYMGLKVKRA